MDTGTGVWGIVVALGALVLSAASSKDAEARSSHSQLTSFKPQVELSAPHSTNALPAEATSPPAMASASVERVELVTPPHLLENLKLRRLLTGEISPAMLEKASDIVRRYHGKPVGTEITVEVEGQRVVARIERHFHPEGGPIKPWGFHPGVSLFVDR